MTTALKIIERGASKAKIKTAGISLSAEEVTDGLDVLNDIIKEWTALGILTGVSPTYDANVDLMEPEYSTPALKAQVGLRMSVEYGGDPSMLIADANNSYSAMLIAKPKQRFVMPDTLPLGSGNHDEYYDSCDDDFFSTNFEENF
jgi:hypothetical protein